jgi:hypothetical protein
MDDQNMTADDEREFAELLARVRKDVHQHHLMFSDLVGAPLPMPSDVRIFERPRES